jgi:hemerythrin-like domain-containing protein
VTEQAQGGALDTRQREALEAALRYFREAAPRHTADEEESLFPKMRAHGGELAREALEKIAALEADHIRAKHSHDIVEQLGSEWLRNGALAGTQVNELVAHLYGLQKIYERHIAVEDEEIFPLAGKVLDSATLREVGQEMAARRGQKFESPFNPRR